MARFKLINLVAGPCLWSLEKLGMREEISRFVTRLHDCVLSSTTLDEFRAIRAIKRDVRGMALQTLLPLATGWTMLGLRDQATPILAMARNELLDRTAIRLLPKDYVELACAYVNALGVGPLESGLSAIIELLRKMPRERITNTWTTADYYSRFHLNLVEAVVFAVCRMASESHLTVLAPHPAVNG